MRRILGVFAHPDDECYGPGGTLARCVLEGGEVFVTCFTAGEAGSIGISRELERDELARRRRVEMAGACAALGVSDYRILGVPDGGVARVDAAWAVREILADMDRYRPDIVVTFHHGGVSGHPDHIAVAGFLLAAFDAAGESGPHRYFEWGITNKQAALYDRTTLVPVNDDEVVARVTISDAAMDRKLAAIRAHETQIAFFNSLTFDYRAISRPEHFGLRRWRGERPVAAVSDLFEGMSDA